MAQTTTAIARRGAVSRLLFGPDGSTLVVDSAGLLASGQNGELRTAYQHVLKPIIVIPGLLWSRAEVSTVDGIRLLAGFPQTGLEQVVAVFNAGLEAWFAERLSSTSRDCSEAQDRADALQTQSRYVRDSERMAVDAAVEASIALSKQPMWQTYANSAQRNQVDALRDYLAHSRRYVAEANAMFVDAELTRFQGFFDAVESNPLTRAQRAACVINEERNLVLAGAGTGKTSVMIGRAGYLISSSQVRPEQILMLAYGRKAMEEMQERQDSRLGDLITGGTPKINTFHALGLEIIGLAEGRRPDITPMAEDPKRFARFVDDQISSLGEDPDYRRRLVQYDRFDRFPFRTPFDFGCRSDYDEYVRTNELVTLHGEAVKSFEEVVVANFLSAYGVEYEYERPYPFDTATASRRQYKPDFYLPAYNIYIEHFALDRSGKPPTHFGPQYAQGVIWKRGVHREHDTTLLETYSHLKKEGILESTLEAKLLAAGVELVRRSDEDLLRELRESTRYTYLADLITGFITLFKESGLSLADLRAEAAQGRDRSRHGLLLDLIEPILDAYERELSARGQIDFGDMISRAAAHVSAGRYTSPYAHILVDEFQDISQSRMRLLQALVQNAPDTTLFVVGDDWQAIFGFTGSDVALTREFEQRLGFAATTALDTTFRFNDQIGAVASRFVQQNPAQIKKSLGSLVHESAPAVSLLGIADATAGLRLCVEAIAARGGAASSRRTTVLVLSRYNFTHAGLEQSPMLNSLRADHPMLDIRFMSMHGAKGKEADYVVVVGLQSGKNGFPTRKPVDGLLRPLLPPVEEFKFAEERRVFYVALTRARQRVYLVYDPDKPSVFVTELLETDTPYPIVRDEFPGANRAAPPVPCPRCDDGTLVIRQGTGTPFAGCSNYPYCRYTAPTCVKCGSVVRVSEGRGVCSNPDCGAEALICPLCGGRMVERKGPRGSRFLGCTNYASDNCTHTIRLPAK